MELYFEFPHAPPSINHSRLITKKFKRVKTKKTRDFEEKVCKILKQEYLEKPLEQNLQVELTFSFKNPKRKDVDNYPKHVLDCLNGIVWKDDSQIQKLVLLKNYSKEEKIFCRIINFEK